MQECLGTFSYRFYCLKFSKGDIEWQHSTCLAHTKLCLYAQKFAHIAVQLLEVHNHVDVVARSRSVVLADGPAGCAVLEQFYFICLMKLQKTEMPTAFFFSCFFWSLDSTDDSRLVLLMETFPLLSPSGLWLSCIKTKKLEEFGLLRICGSQTAQ